jgi:2-polyprenyl-6-methoxyphenol hydroxylase-like FAD-dependent oxidoreductase
MTSAGDVLVVGAGPTGLTAALTAAAHGADVRIVDRRPERSRPSRAMMLHSRALECLRPMGVTDDLLDRADTSPEARLHLGRHLVAVRLGHVDLPDTAFPHLTLVRQADVEEVLCSALRARGVRVEWGVELRGLTSSPDGADAVLTLPRTPGRKTEQHRSQFVAGCDGQSSTVRGLVGARWRGAPYRVEAVLADLELDGPLPPGLLHVAVGKRGLTFLFALGEGATWRMLATRRACPGPARRFGELGPGVPADELLRLLHDSGLGVTIQELRWSAQVPLQHRLASRFRRDRLFLAGDAAHAHSPAGGQGMNNGILDAVNLGWKLAFASQGGTSDVLLDSYEQERRRAAREVLALTHVIFFGEASQHPAAQLARGTLLPYAAPLLPLLLRQRRLTAAGVRLLAQPFVRYSHSALAVDAGAGAGRWPRPGHRLPDQRVVADGRATRLHDLTATPGVHLLLERDARIDPAAVGMPGPRPWIHVHRLSSHAGSGVVALRPDGYVGLHCRGADSAQLAGWLDLVGALPGRGGSR